MKTELVFLPNYTFYCSTQGIRLNEVYLSLTPTERRLLLVFLRLIKQRGRLLGITPEGINLLTYASLRWVQTQASLANMALAYKYVERLHAKLQPHGLVLLPVGRRGTGQAGFVLLRDQQEPCESQRGAVQ